MTVYYYTVANFQMFKVGERLRFLYWKDINFGWPIWKIYEALPKATRILFWDISSGISTDKRLRMPQESKGSVSGVWKKLNSPRIWNWTGNQYFIRSLYSDGRCRNNPSSSTFSGQPGDTWKKRHHFHPVLCQFCDTQITFPISPLWQKYNKILPEENKKCAKDRKYKREITPKKKYIKTVFHLMPCVRKF